VCTYIYISVKMYLYPSESGLNGPVMSIQTVENGVSTKCNFPIGAFPAVTMSHTMLQNFVFLINKILVVLCSVDNHLSMRRYTVTANE